MIDKFYLLCVIFSGSPDLTLKTCLVAFVIAGQEICCYGKGALIATKNEGCNETLSLAFCVAEVVVFTKLTDKARNR